MSEYVDCCLTIGRFYSVPAQTPSDSEDNQIEFQFMKVVGKHNATHKPKVLKTHDENEDLYADCLVIEVHMMDMWQARGGGQFCVVFDDCPVMLSPF